ncbi:immunoglobulin-like domain-containing protein [Listeria kieliensis]|uniref:Bacterial Ig domain-containing protein n=1 Tax=Listeria kieliensis TaxID=1621700 RepID=A0A3D8TTB9_9LIST|nr:immunoglobulin-like domain-containing protein [Listeria kieliensis]RDX02220.1 hypothetical protein UR08_01425 [Listeria kieliensis]
MKSRLKHASKITAIALLMASVGFSTAYPVQAAEGNNLTKQEIIEEGKQKAAKFELSAKEEKAVKENTRAIVTADNTITSLMLKKRNTTANLKTEFTYTPKANAASPYDGGTLNLYARIPMQGNVFNRSILPTNGIEHIKNFEEGNYGARVKFVFPKGVDAKAMVETIDWQATQKTTKNDFYIKAIGIPTPVHLTWGIKFDQTSVIVNNQKPNEFSIVVRGIKKAEVSDAEWEKYNPAVTYGALAFIGALPGGGILGNMDGWVEGAIKFDMSKYLGNTDDVTKNKELTAKRLFPDENHMAKYTMNVLDQNALIASTSGKGNISKAEVRGGHEYDNPQTSNGVPTWDSYLSIWDNEQGYNTNTIEEDLVPGEKNALPGNSIFNRNIAMKNGDNFNDFKKNRFDRVINYFTKENVTNGYIGLIDSVSVSHTPTKVGNGTTEVKYTGNVRYTDGQTRELIPNHLNVTNGSSSSNTQGNISPNAYRVGELNMTGAYTGDVSWARLYVNGTPVRSGGTFNNGQFTFYAGGLNVRPSDRVTFNVYDKNNKLLQGNVSVQIVQGVTGGAIYPGAYTVGSSGILGSYTGDVSLAHLLVNGRSISWGGSFSNGQFSYYVKPGSIKLGDFVALEAYDKSGKKLDSKLVLVNSSRSGVLTSAGLVK